MTDGANFVPERRLCEQAMRAIEEAELGLGDITRK
jgi:hypothetical protein